MEKTHEDAMNFVCRRLPSQLPLSSGRPSQLLVGICRRKAPVYVCCWSRNKPTTQPLPFSSSAIRRDDSELRKLDHHEQEDKLREHQVKRPWHREDADAPPVKELGSEKQPLKKGKHTLLTVPVISPHPTHPC